ncbi:hypothetical protein PYW08_016809 [Mythimna loreyi]|uniref:Uncharacterized protein n=1 Tax=Mythimna loreyi TaxID=667449 RepID=A0ACC2QYP1_9NEOP|nr:hypothetical protein PYW08_016809 [Mythimna loreyi]
MPQKMVLSDHTLKKLVKEIKKRECLWNPNHDRYNDRYRMAKAWMEIADVMQLPEERLRVKWKNLRDLFKKEIKKFGSEELYTGKWRHFEMLKFINTSDNGKSNGKGSKTSGSDENNVETVEAKEEIEDEYEFEVEQEPEEGNNEVEVYLDESYVEEPIPEKVAKLSSNEDYDVMFLKSLAPYFKQLDPIRKLVVRSKMQDMLLNEIAAQTSASQFNLKKS